MLRKEIPQVEFCHIGGSGTWGCNFPEEILFQGVKVLETDMEFDTPFGRTTPMKLLELSGDITADHKPRLVLDVVFHGWGGLSPYDETPEERIFWVFQKAGVKYVLADGTVGCVNPLLETGDVIIPSDFIDYTKRYYNINKFTSDIIRMADIVCPDLKSILVKNASTLFKRVFAKGTYGVYEAPRFETRAETRRFQNDGCDVAAHTMMPEAALARAIGACYAPMYYVIGYAEGIVCSDNSMDEDWNENMALRMGKVLLQTLADIDKDQVHCKCIDNHIQVSSSIMKRIEPKQKREEKG